MTRLAEGRAQVLAREGGAFSEERASSTFIFLMPERPTFLLPVTC